MLILDVHLYVLENRIPYSFPHVIVLHAIFFFKFRYSINLWILSQWFHHFCLEPLFMDFVVKWFHKIKRRKKYDQKKIVVINTANVQKFSYPWKCTFYKLYRNWFPWIPVLMKPDTRSYNIKLLNQKFLNQEISINLLFPCNKVTRSILFKCSKFRE